MLICTGPIENDDNGDIFPTFFVADLRYSESDGSAIYWTKLMHEIKEEGEWWRTGFNVLQHMEDRETAQEMKGAI